MLMSRIVSTRGVLNWARCCVLSARSKRIPSVLFLSNSRQHASHSSTNMEGGALSEDIAVTRFRQYLRINTSQPEPNYAEATAFFKNYALELGLQFSSFKVSEKNTVDILTWPGTEPSLPSIMLYSHTDVVPSFPEHWTHPPFSAHKDEQGNIYARGSQDMKCVGIQYLEAIRKLKSEGASNKRSLHVTFVPDEEIGGFNGMIPFVKTEEFKTLNVGFALDEGLANPGQEFRVFYAERNVWWLEVICPGSPGHGSSFLKNTAGEKVQKVINRFLQLRSEQEARLAGDEALSLGDVTSVNLTMLKGGVQYNVVPDTMSAGFDIRIPPNVNLEEFEKELEKWREEAGSDVSFKFHHKTTNDHKTATDASSPWWVAFSKACDELGITLRKEIFPAGTDGRNLRMLNIPVLGFSPMNNTPVLLHDHNEYLNEAVFQRGVDIYRRILQALANV